MFTVEQIKTAHSKVKSGADFPNYIREIKALGVQGYEYFVSDGHVVYYDADNFVTEAAAKYDSITIATQVDANTFKAELLAHQQGKTDFLTFINMCATFGIEKWNISMEKMTCTYYDISGNEILVEQILE